MTPRTLARLKILVADDNTLLRRGLKDMLSLWGVSRVVTAGDGGEAREILSSEPIDLVVTDWVMAPADGAALLNWIRHAPDSPRHDLPVIVLTAQADVPTVRAAWDIGADAVLAKPVSAVVIARRIEAVLEIVIDGLSFAAVQEAMRAGLHAAAALGRGSGLRRIAAGNYGGKLGRHHFHLKDLL